MLKNIIIFVSLIVLVIAGHKKAKDESLKTKEMDVSQAEEVSKLEYEGTETETQDSENSNISPDESINDLMPKVRDYFKNLDCRNTKMGLMKCAMVRKVSKKYEKNPNRDPAKMKSAAIEFINDLKANNQLDPELEELIEEYQRSIKQNMNN